MKAKGFVLFLALLRKISFYIWPLNTFSGTAITLSQSVYHGVTHHGLLRIMLTQSTSPFFLKCVGLGKFTCTASYIQMSLKLKNQLSI